MTLYKVQYDILTGKCLGVIRVADSASIPKDTANKDWLDFLKANAVDPAPLDLTDQVIIPETQQEYKARLRNGAVTLFEGQAEQGQALRGLALVTMDEVNSLRAWITSFKAAVNLATTLADLKTRVAALPNVPQRQATDIKPAIVAKINSAEAD